MAGAVKFIEFHFLQLTVFYASRNGRFAFQIHIAHMLA